MVAMNRLDASSNATSRRIRSYVAPQRDRFAMAISIGLLSAIVLVCAVLVTVPLLTIVLR